MTDDSGTSPCFLFHHQYVGPYPAYGPSRFTIHCTLEKGAEAYYSGIRVIVIAKKIGYDDNFAKAEIQKHRRVIPVAGKPVGIEPPEDTETVIDDRALSVDGLPLYTLILELVDLSDAEWTDAEIRFQAAVETSSPGPLQQIPDTHRVLYEYAKHSMTGHSPFCFLPLATRYVELQRRQLKQQRSRSGCGPGSVWPIPIGLPPTHGFRILPPSERRPVFTQPPPEILYHIFSILAYDGGPYCDNWRKGLVAAGLVCRAWKVALRVIYEDFACESPMGRLQIERFAMTLEDNPMWGRYIKRFPLGFGDANIEAQLQGEVLTILKTASNMRWLPVRYVSDVLTAEFIEAFCKMTELRYYVQYSTNAPDDDSEDKNCPNAAQLTKCFAHWPKLRNADVNRFGPPHAEDGNEFAPAQCALDSISFGNGLVSIAQLRAITASSQDTLHLVDLSCIRGISNKELTSWLFDFGANLTILKLESNIFTRSEAEEPAIDATIHKMPKLFDLEIDGPVASVLTLLRYEPTGPYEQERRITIDPVLFDLRAFVKALRTTKWEVVDVPNLVSWDERELIDEAERVAKERGIDLTL